MANLRHVCTLGARNACETRFYGAVTRWGMKGPYLHLCPSKSYSPPSSPFGQNSMLLESQEKVKQVLLGWDEGRGHVPPLPPQLVGGLLVSIVWENQASFSCTPYYDSLAIGGDSLTEASV